LGIIYYAALIAFAATDWPFGSSLAIHFTYVVFSPKHILLIPPSGVTVVLGFYLIYALRRKLHTHCPLCYLGHAINAALFIILLVGR
jgi:hypothetical protein